MANIRCYFIAGIFILALTLPWIPVRAGTIGYFDFSWMLVLHDAVATGRQFGPQLIVPYGPTGFLATNVYDPRTYLILMAARLLMSMAALLMLIESGRKLFNNPLAALPWMLGIIAMMGPGITAQQASTGNFDPKMLGGTEDHFFSICALLTLLSYFCVHGRRMTRTIGIMIVVLAVASLAKVNFLMQDVIVIGAIAFDQLFFPNDRTSQPRTPFLYRLAAPGIYIVSLVVFYVATRQSPASIVRFLWGWWQVTVGHMDAVALPGTVVDVVAYLVVAGGIIALVGYVELARQKWRGVLVTFTLAGVLALLYKHSFVRQDFAHATIAPMAALATAIFYAPIAMKAKPIKVMTGLVITLITVAAVVVWSSLMTLTGQGLPEYAWTTVLRTVDSVGAAASAATSPGHLRKEWVLQRYFVIQQNPLPSTKIVGPVDVYPHRQDVLFAYHLAYDPRPAFSSLFATAPALAELNAQHLRSPSAPQTILFDIEPVDQQFPALADGISWPDLLSRYSLVDRGAFLVLARRSQPASVNFEPMTTLSARFSEPLAIPPPARGTVWAKIALKRRLGGKIVSTLYKPPLVQIEVTTRNGDDNAYRLLPTIAEQGFLLSPLIVDRLDFAKLYSSTWQADLSRNEVTKIIISVVDGSQDMNYDSRFTVQFQRLVVGN